MLPNTNNGCQCICGKVERRPKRGEREKRKGHGGWETAMSLFLFTRAKSNLITLLYPLCFFHLQIHR